MRTIGPVFTSMMITCVCLSIAGCRYWRTSPSNTLLKYLSYDIYYGHDVWCKTFGPQPIDPDFKIEITELDISCYPRDSKEVQKALSDSFIKRFDAKYAQLFRTFMNLSEQGILDTVVFWGYFDGASWLNESPVENRTDYPLLIDRSMKFKSAYWAVYHLPFKDDEAN